MTESCDFNLTHISICNKILMNDSCEMNTDLGNYNLMKKGECDMLSKTLTVVNPSLKSVSEPEGWPFARHLCAASS